MFKHVTLYLDGHDSRATYGEDKAAMYSYKLKKSGLRTQVAIDANGMVLFVSKSASCRDNNDGKMLQEMGIGKKINNMDCIALDGGYTQYIGDIVEKEKLDERNFCFPIRKKRLQQLHEEESNFNAMFGGFRSTSEAVFGNLMKTFAKFNNKEIKSGLRTQVAIDANGMVLFVSKSASCRDNNDGKMLQEMGIGKKINNMDCIALDGGYTQYIGDIVEKEKLDERNFCFPIRKKRLQQLHEEESNFNAMFGGFRSTSEAVFGDLMKTFAKFNNKEIYIQARA
ncbi:hypothetical protein KI688_011879 [Linnemannia hyalina]|uniref:DDE Tnp4 domain-containing protein n=1 Tax=Linnemannia hyalina TaxID=64524 RepID=A0A9P7XUY7_9FUNG|nr:hypothetical protein KI688_011879 [Linnemannia hyalina]